MAAGLDHRPRLRLRGGGRREAAVEPGGDRRMKERGERHARNRYVRSSSRVARFANTRLPFAAWIRPRCRSRIAVMAITPVNAFRDQAANTRGRLIGIYAVLVTANLLAWAWALVAFHAHPVLLGTAFLAYTFGLRHAVDADHIAAIDNVTRKLMQSGKRPVSVGFFFELGHSTVVVLASLGVAAATAALQD